MNDAHFGEKFNNWCLTARLEDTRVAEGTSKDDLEKNIKMLEADGYVVTNRLPPPTRFLRDGSQLWEAEMTRGVEDEVVVAEESKEEFEASIAELEKIGYTIR
jgi:hypothetical protein